MKNVNKMGKWWKIGGERGNFHCTSVKKYHVGKSGGRGKNIYFREIYTPVHSLILLQQYIELDGLQLQGFRQQ